MVIVQCTHRPFSAPRVMHECVSSACAGRTRAIERLSAAVVVASLLAACASEPIALRTRPAPIPAREKIARPVAFLHTPSFREDTQTVEPYGNRYYAQLKTGEASDRVLRAAYAATFAQSREIAARDELARIAGDAPPLALLQPEIAGMQYLNASGRMDGPYYAEMRYRYTLSEANGVPIVAWTVRGFAVYSPDEERRMPAGERSNAPRGEHEIYSEAPLRAIEAAARQFVLSFERVPELIAWARGRPASALTRVDQVTQPLAGGAGFAGDFAGAFTLEAQRTALPRPPRELVNEEDQARRTPLVAVRVTLRNVSQQRIAVDPADIEWVQPDGSRLEPLPAPVASALLTGRPFGMTVAVFGPGLAALPAAIAALASAGSAAEKKKELAAWVAAMEGDMLGDATTSPGATRTGTIVFRAPPNLSGELVVPVVDIDGPVRYIVRLPFPRSDGP